MQNPDLEKIVRNLPDPDSQTLPFPGAARLAT